MSNRFVASDGNYLSEKKAHGSRPVGFRIQTIVSMDTPASLVHVIHVQLRPRVLQVLPERGQRALGERLEVAVLAVVGLVFEQFDRLLVGLDLLLLVLVE